MTVTLALCAGGCTSPQDYKEEADRQVYSILQAANAAVTGVPATVPVERPVDTLRERLLAAGGANGAAVRLGLADALDVAAENSRDFQRQRELLYLAALALTREQHQFAIRYSGGASAGVDGESDDEIDLGLSGSLAASKNFTSGGRIVASFVNSWLRSIVHDGDFTGASILGMTLTQPLLRGAGTRIAREPLTQAERDVIYQVRDYERFRRELAVRITSEYYGVVQQIENLQDVRKNLESLQRNRELVENLAQAGRSATVDVGRARQSELTAEARVVTAQAQLRSALDRFKLTLGLPIGAELQLDTAELERLRTLGVQDVTLPSEVATAIAWQRRLDLRNQRDTVEDAARRILVARDALQSFLDFSAAFSVPTDDEQPFDLDWSRVTWSAGFDLDLALDRLPERNTYRSSLISLDTTIRAREQLEDQVQVQVRDALRNIRSNYQTYLIQLNAVALAEQRVESTKDLYAAGRLATFEVLDAETDYLAAQLDLTAALVDYAIARLQLLRDLEALELEPKGLRYDPALLIPELEPPAAPAGAEKP